MVLAGLCMWNVITKYSKYGRYPKFWNHVPKKNWLHKIKKMLTVAEFSWFAIIVKPCFDQKITFEIEKSKKIGQRSPLLIDRDFGQIVETQNGTWLFCGNTKWHMAFLCKHKMARGWSLPFCGNTKCHSDILCFHKMSLWHFVFPQIGINIIYYHDCSLAPLAGHFYFIDFFEGSDQTWIFGLKSNDLESSWQQFQPSLDSVFHRGTSTYMMLSNFHLCSSDLVHKYATRGHGSHGQWCGLARSLTWYLCASPLAFPSNIGQNRVHQHDFANYFFKHMQEHLWSMQHAWVHFGSIK